MHGSDASGRGTPSTPARTTGGLMESAGPAGSVRTFGTSIQGRGSITSQSHAFGGPWVTGENHTDRLVDLPPKARKGGGSMKLMWTALTVALMVAAAVAPYTPTILGIRVR